MRINIRLPLLITKFLLNLSIISTVIFIILLPLSITITLTFYNSLIPYDSITHIPLDFRHFKTGQKLSSLDFSQLVTVLMDDIFDIDFKNRRWFLNSNLGLFNNEFNGHDSNLELEMSVIMSPSLKSPSTEGDLLNFRMVVLDLGDWELSQIDTIHSLRNRDSGWLICSDFNHYDKVSHDPRVFGGSTGVIADDSVYKHHKYNYRFESSIPVFKDRQTSNTIITTATQTDNNKWFVVPPIFKPFISPFIYDLLDISLLFKAFTYTTSVVTDLFKSIAGYGDTKIYDSHRGDIVEVKVIDRFVFSNKDVFVEKDRKRLLERLKSNEVKFVFEFNQANNFLFSKISSPVSNSLNHYTASEIKRKEIDLSSTSPSSPITREIGLQGEGDILLRFKFKYLDFRYYLNRYKLTFIFLFSLLFWILSCLGFWIGLGSIYYGLGLIFKSDDESPRQENGAASLESTEVKIKKQQNAPSSSSSSSSNPESTRGPNFSFDTQNDKNERELILRNLDSLIED